MEGSLVKHILLSISVVLLSTLIATISWTVVLGSSIASAWQSDVITYYSEAGLSMMVDANNLKSLDAANFYKMMEVNRNVITDYNVKNLDDSYVVDLEELLSRPTDRFSVIIRGDSSVGFEVTAEQVE